MQGLIRGHLAPQTPLDFSVWDIIKDQVFVQPLPADLLELRNRIYPQLQKSAVTIAQLTPDLLARICNETDLTSAVYHITKGAHVEPK